jgi:hypothetical protein
MAAAGSVAKKANDHPSAVCATCFYAVAGLLDVHSQLPASLNEARSSRVRFKEISDER